MPAFRLPFLLLAAAPILATGEELSFNADIRPLLSDRCFACHGFDANTREADLRLDTPEAAYAERDGGPAIVPGDPGRSMIWQRIISDDPDEVMPPPNHLLGLKADEKEKIRLWIEQGAKYEKHWTFTRVEKPDVPANTHPVDALVTRRLSKEDLKLSPRAEKTTLIRRLSLDLRGLPPTPDEVAGFLADDSAEAWANLVDRFLADPAFGERMAWPWLDAARYADTNGYQHDAERTMWPWRDWVVGAINDNLPYNDFTVWQIAGDLLPEATFEQKLATGFLRNHAINGEGGRIPEENRVDYVMDMTETVGTVWMALTMNCCRCHDHKYDPISQKEYYGLADFFNQMPIDGADRSPQSAPNLAVPSTAQKERLNQLAAQVHKAKEALDAAPEDAELKEQLKKAEGERKKHESSIPKVMIMADQEKRRPSYILAVGSYEQPGEEVTAHTPAVLPPMSSSGEHANRLDLAYWLTSRDHPLMSRATVNRLWQEIFGLGFVKTPEDFGVQSEIPKHPELIDWLAADFMDHGWDFKRLVRTIVTSEVYQQSSRVTPELLERDPDNRLLARGPRFRMPAWMIRDQALSVSGLLVNQMGGEPVFPWQPAGLWAEVTFGGGKKKYTPDTGEKLRRRSLYTFWRRISAPPMFFDNAKREVCEVGALRTNSPLHALSTLNDRLYSEAARALASRATQAGAPDQDAATSLNEAFRLVLLRPPSDDEQKILRENYQMARESFEADPDSAKAFLAIGETPPDAAMDAITQASLATVCLSILNTDEALTKE